MPKLTYKQAGVDIKKGDEASHKAYMEAKKTYRKEVTEMGGIPGFAAQFAAYKQPYMLGATDGVGTKLKIAFMMNIHNTIGIDLVAMCVNDLIRRGAEPIMFLPYLAISQIEPDLCGQIASGVAEGCRQANCTIMGGETAELPDFYQKGEYDVAGSAIGVVDKSKFITGEKIKEGDILLGLPSSGIHSNGYSLARKALLPHFKLTKHIPELGKTLGEELLTPTKIYVKEMLKVLRSDIDVHGVAHITGSGIYGKLGKIIPKGLSASINKKTWEKPEIFSLIQKMGDIEEQEMFHTFNMGIGMVVVVPKAAEKQVRSRLREAVYIGDIIKGKQPVVIS